MLIFAQVIGSDLGRVRVRGLIVDGVGVEADDRLAVGFVGGFEAIVDTLEVVLLLVLVVVVLVNCRMVNT